jgi:guanylate kinase
VQKKKSLIIVISAPSGSGKTTIITKLLEKTDGVKRSVSETTRQPRAGEEDGTDYHFITEEEFKRKIDENGFLEWEENFGYYYGTPIRQFEEAVDKGLDIILSIDVKGARNVKNRFPESISVFVMPPSKEELAQRLKGRNTDQEKQVSMRLEEAKREIEAADEYDYLIVNEDLDEAVEELKGIIENERKNVKQREKADGKRCT